MTEWNRMEREEREKHETYNKEKTDRLTESQTGLGRAHERSRLSTLSKD